MDDPLIERLRGFGTTIFAEMSALATATGSVNLGQGFPDEDGPREVLDAAVAAIRGGHNQYPPGRGFPELRAAIARHQRRCYGLSVDPDTEVLVTVGATEAIASVVLALCEPGDEVVVFEPYYDSYAATIALAGAVRRTVPLRFPDYHFTEADLRAAFSPRTRLVLVNTPHNPTGKVFTAAELTLIASVAREHDAWLATDEVYEHLTFDGARHVPAASLPVSVLPGDGAKVLTISSGGKTFSTTGWKVGWVTGSAAGIAAVTGVKQWLTYVGSGPFQYAVAHGLGLPDAVFAQVAADLAAKRDLLLAGLVDAGFTVNAPAGTYFVIADAAAFGVRDGVAFARELPGLCGVVGVPVAVFHDDAAGAGAESLIRFAFCKRREVLDEGVRRLRTLSSRLA